MQICDLKVRGLGAALDVLPEFSRTSAFRRERHHAIAADDAHECLDPNQRDLLGCVVQLEAAMQSMMPGRAEGAVMTISAENEARESQTETREAQTEARESHWIWASLIDNLPYVTIVALALVGISLSSLSSTPSVNYWVVVTPIIAAICILEGWRHVESGQRIAEAVTQALQWVTVLIAMYLLTIGDTQRALSAQALGLMTLTLLGLGVVVSGLNLRSWKLCLTGAFLIVSVPATAWLQNAALLLTLVGLALIALLFFYWWISNRVRATL